MNLSVSSILSWPRLAAGLSVLVLAACATGAPPLRPAPERPEPPSAEVEPAEPGPEAPRDWHRLDATTDRVQGIGVQRALDELLTGREPGRVVTVAVIDGGVDTAHVGLVANLWSNPDETPGNDTDDDGNGYADDVWGWNFIGGADGNNVRHDTFEVTRLHAQCTGAPAGGTAGPPPAEAECQRLVEDFEDRRREAAETLGRIEQIDLALGAALPVLREALGSDSLSVESVTDLRSFRGDVRQARQLYLDLAEAGIAPESVDEAKTAYESQMEYGYNPAFDPRSIVGDEYADPSQRSYGNRDVMGPDASHGTHVAGIIGASRDSDEGVIGIAPAVRIMAVRAVPDGDERDKDVANAIRYAVDNGAQIINMSFGKAYSPEKQVVDDAVRYADERGVLIIHAAGNDGEDLAPEPNFPNRVYEDGGRAANWIEVGASSWRGPDDLAAPFSNYGAGQVDVFAPGVDILSTEPDGEYGRNSGTSMAAPVVSGLAALLMAYYRDLTAGEVKRIILESATKLGEQMVVRPGSEDGAKVPFGSLSATGGIVNAYEAVRMAEQVSRQR